MPNRVVVQRHLDHTAHPPRASTFTFLQETPKFDGDGRDWKKIPEIRRLFDVIQSEESWQSTPEAAQLSTQEEIVGAFYSLIRCTQLQPTASGARRQSTTESIANLPRVHFESDACQQATTATVQVRRPSKPGTSGT